MGDLSSMGEDGLLQEPWPSHTNHTASPDGPFDEGIDSLDDLKKRQQLQGLSGVLLERTYSLIIDSDAFTRVTCLFYVVVVAA